MTVYGWINVEDERTSIRTLFHQAYKDNDMSLPKSITAKLDDKMILYFLL